VFISGRMEHVGHLHNITLLNDETDDNCVVICDNRDVIESHNIK
jgi:hypothetical protein